MNRSDLKFAWWLTRGQTRRVGLLILCIALGVAARVAIGLFIGQLDKSLSREAQNLLAADLEISSRLPLSEQQQSQLHDLLPPKSKIQQKITFLTMGVAPANGKTRLLEVQAIEKDYPFYGKLQLSETVSPAIEKDRDRVRSPLEKINSDLPYTYVQKEFLAQMDIKAGDFIRIGKVDFQIAGTILREPGLGTNIFSLGPKILIGLNQASKTGLMDTGSRLYYSTLVSLPNSSLAVPIAQQLKKVWNIPKSRRLFSESLGPETINVRTFYDKQEQISHFFDHLGNYLRLVSLIALLLGGIGVASVVRSFIAENLSTAAILRILGADTNKIVKIFFVQLLVLGLFGSLLGIILGILLQTIFPLMLSDFIPVALDFGINLNTILWGLSLGTFAAVYFGASSILILKNAKPLPIFRGESIQNIRKLDQILIFLLGILVLSAVAVMETDSLTLGITFSISTLVGGTLIYLISRLILPWLSRRRQSFKSFSMKQGIANLSRTGLRPYSAVVSIGLSVLFFGLLALYQHSLSKELNLENPDKAPNFFLIDIQDDQVTQLKDFFNGHGISQYVLSPMVKGRYRKLNGNSINKSKTGGREDESAQHMRNREQNLSYREQLGTNEKIIDGTWMNPDSKKNEASLEEKFADRLGARLDDILTFDVQGVEINAKVTSIRKVRWSSFLPTFFILITPSALIDAPKTWVGSISAGLNDSLRTAVQKDLVKFFPNITIFDVAQTTQKIINVLENILWAVRFVAIFSLMAGLLVLVSIAFSTAQQRRKETLLLRILGADKSTILSSIGTEFSLLGIVSVFAGSLLAILMGWIIITQFLNLSFHISWLKLFLISIVLIFLCAVTGIMACWNLFNLKPLALLREQ